MASSSADADRLDARAASTEPRGGTASTARNRPACSRRGLHHQQRYTPANQAAIRNCVTHSQLRFATTPHFTPIVSGNRHLRLPPTIPEAKQHDVFISHASEDKSAIVRPLALALQACGLAVWYDEFELRIGSSLRRSIDQGLASSRFGVVVLSDAFFSKGWANYELDGLVTRELASEGRQIILPLWHGVSKEDVIAYSPSLADKLALRTSDSTVAEIAAEIAAVVGASSGDEM
jgi:TIR domain